MTQDKASEGNMSEPLGVILDRIWESVYFATPPAEKAAVLRARDAFFDRFDKLPALDPSAPLASPREGLRELHMAFNVAIRRNRPAAGVPACDGPDCEICRDVSESEAWREAAQSLEAMRETNARLQLRVLEAYRREADRARDEAKDCRIGGQDGPDDVCGECAWCRETMWLDELGKRRAQHARLKALVEKWRRMRHAVGLGPFETCANELEALLSGPDTSGAPSKP